MKERKKKKQMLLCFIFSQLSILVLAAKIQYRLGCKLKHLLYTAAVFASSCQSDSRRCP